MPSLGFKYPEMSIEPKMAHHESKVHYPSLRIDMDSPAFLTFFDYDIGHECEVTCTFKVVAKEKSVEKSEGHDEKRGSVTVEVLDAYPVSSKEYEEMEKDFGGM